MVGLSSLSGTAGLAIVQLLAAAEAVTKNEVSCGKGRVTEQPKNDCHDGTNPTYNSDPQTGTLRWAAADVIADFVSSGTKQENATCTCTRPHPSSTCYSITTSAPAH